MRGIVMSFSKMGGDLKKDRNPYIRNHSIRDILVWGYEVWDRNGFLGLGMSDLCRYTRGFIPKYLVFFLMQRKHHQDYQTLYHQLRR
jgi:hypothetical protein